MYLLIPRAEKNLKALRDVLEQLPDSAHLTFVGDGPFRQDLEAHFAGCRVTFTVRLRIHCNLGDRANMAPGLQVFWRCRVSCVVMVCPRAV
jgi:hypothetical protein